jgi:hypothetical protein
MPLYQQQKLWLVQTQTGHLRHLAQGKERPRNSTLCGASVFNHESASIALKLQQVTCKKCRKVQLVKCGHNLWDSVLA